MELTAKLYAELSRAFDPDEVEYLARVVKGNRALAFPYVESRSIMTRLDLVVGPGHWSFDYEVITPKQVKGRLTVCGVTKCDAGEAEAEAEPLKSAVSDALKRCGVHFGIGRYLYHLPPQWADYDAAARRWPERPVLNPQAVAKALALCGVTESVDRSTGEVKSTAPRVPAPGTAPQERVKKAMERAEKPVKVDQPGEYVPPDTEGDEKVVQGRRLHAVAAQVGLDTQDRELLHRIAKAALGYEVSSMATLDGIARRRVADWIEEHPSACKALAAEQEEALPLEVEAEGDVPAQLRGA